jgi:hypothetical protein
MTTAVATHCIVSLSDIAAFPAEDFSRNLAQNFLDMLSVFVDFEARRMGRPADCRGRSP